MAIQRVRCVWSGTGVEGPGLTTFFGEADGTVAIAVAAGAFFDRIRSLIPAGTTIQVPQGGDVIEEATGQLVGTWGSSLSGQYAGLSGGAFAAGVGARVSWETGTIRNGRRVRGSTFVVPLLGNSYDPAGTLTAAAITTIESAVTDFLVQVPTQGRIWSRPRPGSAGAAVQIARGVVPDKVSWLRSRRT